MLMALALMFQVVEFAANCTCMIILIRGGTIYTNERGDRAIQLSSRSGVRVYSDRGKRIGPVFSSVEKAQEFLSRN